MIVELNARSRDVFRSIVDSYVATGEPVGSRTLSRRLTEQLSPATIRNIMADLEEQGLLFSPHTSAGRLPTDAGLRLYVDGLLEVGSVTADERRSIESRVAGTGRSVETTLTDATNALSGLSRYAGLVMAPVSERPFRHVEFVPLSPGRALVVLVMDNGMVENRVVDVPLGMSPSVLAEAGNYLTRRLANRNFEEAYQAILREIAENTSQLDEIAKALVETGLATWAGDRERDGGFLLVKGQAHLLEDVTNIVQLERVRALFETIESKKSLLKLLELAQDAKGVQIFIGSENELFGMSGCSMIVAPYRSGAAGADGPDVVGAIGVIGPTRMNYARIIPIVDYTARVVSRLLGSRHGSLDDEV
ncbi:heat-inducible transcription repressor HrcA [Arboricoccus pini]|uniref:Heat-inducible transcription repressor HrcA n=1 Tax=Arboricoccus pini TaxID=1963835 RepID=A0A212RD67_9PROT|nr:heat-inducible transcriptional repressor HrcA [Arboricoccus pini]SNB70195.1 heat-inducible transcription repressor HrcA [Arboricoccus pini]